jgi:hypothetical protein
VISVFWPVTKALRFTRQPCGASKLRGSRHLLLTWDLEGKPGQHTSPLKYLPQGLVLSLGWKLVLWKTELTGSSHQCPTSCPDPSWGSSNNPGF